MDHWNIKTGNIGIWKLSLFILFAACQNSNENSTKNPKHGVVVFQTDFGVKDGAVSAMKGVATGVDPDLKLYDLTHEIPAYNIWEGAYRLEQTATYWPAGTVFVSVVDPGVGTSRKSVVMRSKSGHFFVTPDNGTLTFVAESLGIDGIREINEELNRRKNSGKSYTFHGRDVYAYTGARLAAGVISFEEVGNPLPDSVVRIPYQEAQFQGDSILGSIPILDIQYGNAWTNINDSVFKSLQIVPGKNIEVEIKNNGSVIFKQVVPFVNTFGDVPEGKPLAYMNSLMNFSLAVNMGNFSEHFKVKSGPDWSIVIRKSL
jgi:S-adenosylmethionine hydrolase